MIWHYPTLKDDGWHPSNDNAWPVSGAYHILQMKETPNSLYTYSVDLLKSISRYFTLLNALISA